MMPRPGSRVQVSIAVMDHVELPHPLHPVQEHMNEVLSDQLKDQDSDQQFDPHGKLNQVKKAEFLTLQPGEDTHRGQAEQCIDDHRCRKEDHVHAEVPHLVVAEAEQRKTPFQYPAEGKARKDPGSALPHRHSLEKIEEGFHLNSRMICKNSENRGEKRRRNNREKATGNQQPAKSRLAHAQNHEFGRQKIK